MYLVVAVVSESHERFLDGVFQTAASFLATAGAERSEERGRYLRGGRAGKEQEILRLVLFGADLDVPADAAKARALEGVLRATLKAAGVKTAEVNVFISGDDLEIGKE